MLRLGCLRPLAHYSSNRSYTDWSIPQLQDHLSLRYSRQILREFTG